MWHKPCRTFHPWCLCIKTCCLCTRCFATFHPGSCRFLWFNLCPCRVLCRLTLALAGFLSFNPWTFAHEYTVYKYELYGPRCPLSEKGVELIRPLTQFAHAGFLLWFTRSPPPMNGCYDLTLAHAGLVYSYNFGDSSISMHNILFQGRVSKWKYLS